MYPLKLNPFFTDYIWGGRKLSRISVRRATLIESPKVGLSCHKDGHSTIANGEYKGRTLLEYIEKMGKDILGTNCDKFDDFPILIKLIDAKDNLSVQVHPMTNTGEGLRAIMAKQKCGM